MDLYHVRNSKALKLANLSIKHHASTGCIEITHKIKSRYFLSSSIYQYTSMKYRPTEYATN